MKEFLKKDYEESYYEILGLSKPPSEVEIKRAYRKLTEKYKELLKREDLNLEEKLIIKERLQKIKEAYNTLSDPVKRLRYDNPTFPTYKIVPLEKEKKVPEARKETRPSWLITFSDMMTLLLVFFVLLFSISTMNLAKFKEIMGSIQKGLKSSNLPSLKQLPGSGINYTMKLIKGEGVSRIDLFNDIKKFIQKHGIFDKVEITKDERGTIIRITDPILFESGKAEINKKAYPLLRLIGKAILDAPVEVSIEGHTDNVPIRTSKYPSNWELSTARAVNVLKFFIKECNVPPNKLIAVGYGDQKPLFPNDTEEHRAKNRRVEIIFKNLY